MTGKYHGILQRNTITIEIYKEISLLWKFTRNIIIM